MIYFIHDRTSRAIKIGCARDPRKRLSTLQISTPNELVLLGTIAGTERTETKVHDLVCEHCGPKPGEPYAGPLLVKGEWFDDRILPFVTELMNDPKEYLDAGKKKLVEKPAPVQKDPSLHQGTITLVFDSGERYQESFILKASSPDLALPALENIAHAQLSFLANTVQITELSIPGCPTKKVNLQGAFVTQDCSPREGVSVIFNSEPGNGYGTTNGVKLYSNRWFHGIPRELYDTDNPWYFLPKAQFLSLLNQFAEVLNRNQCVLSAVNPINVKGLIPRGFGLLPKGELRIKANKKVASKRRSQRPPEGEVRETDGIVYFIQDTVTLAVKIGFCLRDPEKRLAALQTGNSNELRLLGDLSGSMLHETLLHTKFFRFYIQGEWFSKDIIVDMEGILKFQSMEEWLKVQDAAIPH